MNWNERAKTIAENLTEEKESEYYQGIIDGYLKGIEDKETAINNIIEWKMLQNNESVAFKPVKNKLLKEVQRTIKYTEAPDH